MKDTYFGKILRVVESLPTTQFPKKTPKGTDTSAANTDQIAMTQPYARIWKRQEYEKR